MIDVALFAFVTCGFLAGLIMIARNQNFWGGLGKALYTGLLPLLLKRMPPDQEKAWRDCQLRGGKWNHRTRRCE